MRVRLLFRSLLVLGLILVPAASARANSLASWVWIWPGVVSIDPLFGLLPTVLVSFVERPFISRAGVLKQPLLRSMRANLLSLLAGIPVALCVWSITSEEGLVLLAAVGVAITIVVEIAYFRFVLHRESKPLRWWWIVAGNIVSNLLLAGLALFVRIVGEKDLQLDYLLLRYQDLFMLMHLGISLTMVTAALAEPTIRVVRLVVAASMEPYEQSDAPVATNAPDYGQTIQENQLGKAACGIFDRLEESTDDGTASDVSQTSHHVDLPQR